LYFSFLFCRSQFFFLSVCERVANDNTKNILLVSVLVYLVVVFSFAFRLGRALERTKKKDPTPRMDFLFFV